MKEMPQLVAQAAMHPYPLLFASLSGAHLYGFPSANSDFDMRGVHLLPLDCLLGLEIRDETVERMGDQAGLDMDLVTHDARKFFRLLLRPNGYVLEQLLSPLQIMAMPELEELQALVPACLTRFHGHHYLGFAANQWKLFGKENPPRIKPLLYVYRVLATGLHLMRTGEVQADLRILNQISGSAFLDDLIRAKQEGGEAALMPVTDHEFHEREIARRTEELRQAMAATHLPAEATARKPLEDLLLRLRKKTL